MIEPEQQQPPHFLEASLSDWQAAVKTAGKPNFKAKQIHDWIWKKRVFHPSDMTNLSLSDRDWLLTIANWSLPEVDQTLNSSDGTTKILLKGPKNQFYEAVIIRYENRITLCVSSQVGCKLACSFCQTGKLGFFRHLTQGEILGQFALAEQIVKAENKRITNVVFMGMGEPLDNYDAAIGAANRLIEPEYFGLSARHVTISTSGIATRIDSMARETRASLAISLHAANDKLRRELMPINQKYSLSVLKESLIHYQATTGRKITIEYILIQNKNCGPNHAKELTEFLRGLRCKVNLIPFNAHPGLPYGRPDDETIRSFQKHLASRSIAAPVRYSRGGDVSAACGQLAAKKEDMLNYKPERKFILGEKTLTDVPPSP